MCRRVRGPIRVGFADSANVNEMNEEFHAQEAEEEAHGVANCPRGLDRERSVPELRDVVVEGENWSREVQRRIEGVGKIVTEGKVSRWRRNSHTITFRQRGRVGLFLLSTVSNVFNGCNRGTVGSFSPPWD